METVAPEELFKELGIIYSDKRNRDHLKIKIRCQARKSPVDLIFFLLVHGKQEELKPLSFVFLQEFLFDIEHPGKNPVHYPNIWFPTPLELLLF